MLILPTVDSPYQVRVWPWRGLVNRRHSMHVCFTSKDKKVNNFCKSWKVKKKIILVKALDSDKGNGKCWIYVTLKKDWERLTVRLTHAECFLCAQRCAKCFTSAPSSHPHHNRTHRNRHLSHFPSWLMEDSGKWESGLINGRAETKTSYFRAYFLNHCVLVPANLKSFW